MTRPFLTQEYYLGDVTYPLWGCLRCGHKWEGRSPEPAVSCPQCKSKDWRYRPLRAFNGRRTKSLSRPAPGTLEPCPHDWAYEKYMEGNWVVERCRTCHVRRGRPSHTDE